MVTLTLTNLLLQFKKNPDFSWKTMIILVENLEEEEL